MPQLSHLTVCGARGGTLHAASGSAAVSDRFFSAGSLTLDGLAYAGGDAGVIPGKRVNERRKSESEAILSAAGLILAQRSNGIDSTGAMGRSKTCQ